jgi:hypothetical protein
LSALLSFAPGLLSKLFGGDPRKKYMAEIQKLLASRGARTASLYQQVQGSPAFSQAQGTIAAGANQASGNLASSLAARGIGTTGTGAVLSSLLPSLVGSQQAGLRTAAYQTAGSQADQDIQAQLAALAGSQGPSQSTNLFAGGLSAFGPLLSQWLKMKYGGGGGGGLPGQGVTWD